MLQRDLSGKAEGDRFAQAARRPQAARDPPEIAKSRRGFDLHDAAARTCLTLTKRVALCAALFPKGVCKGIFPNAANRRRSAPLWNPPHLFSCRMGFSEICAWARSPTSQKLSVLLISLPWQFSVLAKNSPRTLGKGAIQTKAARLIAGRCNGRRLPEKGVFQRSLSVAAHRQRERPTAA